MSPDGIKVDVIPFGDIADADANIEWPPDGETRMSVLGFQEAHEYSDVIRIQADPEIRIRVATPVGMTLLKLIAWNERTPDRRTKDALDLQHLLSSYTRIPEVLEEIYSEPTLGECHDWDTELMGAEVLGQRARQIARPGTSEAILRLGGRSDRVDTLLWEMANGVDRALNRSRDLFGAYLAGFSDSDSVLAG